MYGVFRNHYRPKGDEEKLILEKLCFHSARLRNTGLYNARQYFFENRSYIGDRVLHADTRLNENYRMLICDMGDQTINHVKRDFHSYFGALKALKKEKESNPDTKRKVHLPRYLGKDDLWSFFVAGRSAREKEDGIHVGLTRTFRETYGIKAKELVLPASLPEHGKIRQLEVIPRCRGTMFDIIVVYEKEESEEEEKTELSMDRILAGDVGVNNLIACFSYPDGDKFLIRGHEIKARNQWYNKRKAELQSIYDRTGIKGGKAMDALTRQREDFIDNEFNHIARQLVDYALSKGIGRIVLGWNRGIKDGIGIGKAGNQRFCFIPYTKLMQKIRYRCERAGIVFETMDESHTSKCSAADLESVEHHDVYVGRRVKRGLFWTAQGLLVNADINGAANILRKAMKSNGKDADSVQLSRAVSTGQVRVLQRTWIRKQAPASISGE